jgi:hypothetical protein
MEWSEAMRKYRSAWRLVINSKLLSISTAIGLIFVANTMASAQSVNFGNNLGVHLGDARIAHADQMGVGVKNGQLSVGGGVADGVRIGGQKITTGIQGAAQAPVNVIRHIFPHF